MRRALQTRINSLERTTELAPTNDDLIAQQLARFRDGTANLEDAEAVHRAVLDEIRELHARTVAILRRAEGIGRVEVALKSIREARASLELLARLTGLLDSPDSAARITAVVVLPGPSVEQSQVIELEPLR